MSAPLVVGQRVICRSARGYEATGKVIVACETAAGVEFDAMTMVDEGLVTNGLMLFLDPAGALDFSGNRWTLTPVEEGAAR